MLVIVTSFITIALTYFQLAIEDHRWWWRSLFSGGSTGFFVYAYCFFYYFGRSGMFGFLQTSFFFGYMLLASYAAFIMLGTIGFLSSLLFVRRIYCARRAETPMRREADARIRAAGAARAPRADGAARRRDGGEPRLLTARRARACAGAIKCD